MQRTFTLLLILLMALLPIVTSTPRAAVAQSCEDDAELLEQTIEPAVEVMAPDADFSVAWKLRNVGDCTWSRAYRLIFVSGDRMEGARTTRLRFPVEPDETVTLTLDFTSPADIDSYQGTWRLRNADGDTFGPDLTVDIAVDEVAVSTANTDVVLPEVLIFGGMGAGDDPNALIYCVEDGKLPLVPKIVIDLGGLEYRYTSLYLCSLPEGMTVTVAITDPDGNTFSRDYVEDAEVTHYDENDNAYTGTVLQVPLAWLKQAPAGAWEVKVSGEDYADSMTIDVPEELEWEGEGETDYATLDNWPVAPVDPFAAATSCHYGYLPGQAMMVSGEYLLPDAAFLVGVYQDRLGYGYLVDQLTVQTDDAGYFETLYAAGSEPGTYNFVLMQQIIAEGYSEDGTQYDPGFGGDTGFTCISVVLEDLPEFPLRLAFVSGQPGQAEIEVIDIVTGDGYYPTYTAGNCDTSDPAWWPDEEWIIYQSNCEKVENKDGWTEMQAREDYDLYGSMIDFTYTVPEEQKLVRLTATPDQHETEPDANLDGLIIYRATPVGEMLDTSGEFHLLDIVKETDTPLGLYGRAPVWSPDGTRIAFMSDQVSKNGTWQIYAYDFNTETQWLVSKGCATHCRLPAWSPDGTEIIYHQALSLDDFTPSGMWIAPVKGIARPRLFLEGEYGRPSWSSEGWMVFQGPSGLYRADLTSTGNAIERADTPPIFHRYLYSDPEVATLGAPAWSH